MVQAAFPFSFPFVLQPSQAFASAPLGLATLGRSSAANAASATSAASAASLADAPAAAPPDALSQTGFDIGWDHARHRLTPPVAHLPVESPVRQGWSAGRLALGVRTRRPTAAVRQWLNLRLLAWQHGQAFEAVQVTPNFLAQIDASHCPVSRTPLLLDSGRSNDATVQRLNQQAAYAAGNLAFTSVAVAQARGAMDCQALLTLAQRLAETPEQPVRGLDAETWLRLAVLTSFATPLPHAQAACLPLRVLPPNRVRVINPVQALQVMLTLQFSQAGYARRLLTLSALMPSSDVRQVFQIFMHTLLARRLAAGQSLDRRATLVAMEDSWADTLVNRRWQRLAMRPTPADCEQLLARAQQRGLCVGGGRWLSADQATEGWQLAKAEPAEADQSCKWGAPMPMPTPALAPSISRHLGSQKLAS